MSIKCDHDIHSLQPRSCARGALALLFVLGATWTFGVVHILNETTLTAYLFTFANAFQGMFIFIFLCVLSRKVLFVILFSPNTFYFCPNGWNNISEMSSSSFNRFRKSTTECSRMCHVVLNAWDKEIRVLDNHHRRSIRKKYIIHNCLRLQKMQPFCHQQKDLLFYISM